jgi:hypothetical protein
MYDHADKTVKNKKAIGNSFGGKAKKGREMSGNITNFQSVFQRSKSFPFQFLKRMGKNLKDPTVKFGDPSVGLIDHLKAIWSGNGGAAPTGGHLKTGMEDKWGGWHNSESGVEDGVYCKDGAKLKEDKPTLGLKKYTIKGGRKTSDPKESSFWPAGWDESTLSDTLKDSDQINVALNGGRKQWVSQKPDPIVWESYNKDTAYPIKPN